FFTQPSTMWAAGCREKNACGNNGVYDPVIQRHRKEFIVCSRGEIELLSPAAINVVRFLGAECCPDSKQNTDAWDGDVSVLRTWRSRLRVDVSSKTKRINKHDEAPEHTKIPKCEHLVLNNFVGNYSACFAQNSEYI